MRICPVVVMCLEGVDAVSVVRIMAGTTNSRVAAPGTIRGDFSMSIQENIIHASDSLATAEIEIRRFFADDELFEYVPQLMGSLYANDEI